ncbi:MAG TPA: RNA polymerase factor sigma-54 [Nordella sp.]|nr:RNA polymerase factor sigma-54 [Nordella sp.]
MALTPRLELRQGQSLVMTPQLQQAIKLLQMSNLELQAFVESELEKNPLLERDEKREAPAASEEREERDVASTLKDGAGASTGERLAALGTDLDNVYQGESRADAANRTQMAPADSGWASLKSSRAVSLEDDLEFGATLTRQTTLAEHLTEQLTLAVADPADRLIGQHLIGMVNEAGYLTSDTAQVAEMLGTDVAHVERVLAVLQGFDPAGVFARDLKECLKLQLKEHDRLDPAMLTLVDHLDLVAKRDFAALKNLCKVDADDIRDMIAELRRLNPKPGHVFGAEPVQPVVPDVSVRLAPDGSWLVELNNDTLPRVLVNNRYMAQVSRGAVRDQDKTYLSECHANATWLVRSLDQRAKTILKVAREIVRQQDAFLAYGVQHLRPLNLKTVAEAIEMHESTVSRVTSNKYVATTRGIFELKYFFTTAIGSVAGGEAHSAESVRHRLREMIERETAASILSDDTLVDMLKAEGIDIARRTVAKYRESLGIPSSVQRRREKNAFGS